MLDGIVCPQDDHKSELSEEKNMIAKEISWKGLEVHTREAIWVCVESRLMQVPGTVDGIDYLMEFVARDPHMEGIPATRKLCLRTSEYRVSEPDFLYFLKLVVDGQMMETTPWDRFIEVYERD
jgi:hypothetical protein